MMTRAIGQDLNVLRIVTELCELSRDRCCGAAEEVAALASDGDDASLARRGPR